MVSWGCLVGEVESAWLLRLGELDGVGWECLVGEVGSAFSV